MNQTRFHEVQTISGAFWAFFITLLIAFGVVPVALAGGFSEMPILIPVILGVNLGVCGLVFWLGRLETRVDGEYLRIQFGRGLTWYRTELALSMIEDARAVEYRPIMNAGGWGLRFGRFDGRFATFYNMRGKRGVVIQHEGKQYLIGSQQPEALAAALR